MISFNVHSNEHIIVQKDNIKSIIVKEKEHYLILDMR